MAGVEDIAPDLVVGDAKGTRGSDESALGGTPPKFLVDNTSHWSGDHCMDHEAGPAAMRGPRSASKRAGAACRGEENV